MGRSKRGGGPMQVEKWIRMPEAEAIVARLVGQYHEHLHTASIACIGRPKAQKKVDRITLAKARKAKRPEQVFAAESARPIPTHVIEIALDTWGPMDETARETLIDHELSHFGSQDLETGRWTLHGHDVEEFVDVVGRRGPYTPVLLRFVQAAQMALPLGR